MAWHGERSEAGWTRRNRSQLSDDVARELRARIMSGKLRAGDQIHLTDTAEELDVSITPLRDALISLRGEGLVEPGTKRGFMVSELTRDDVLDVFWLQGVVAGELAQRAARRITPEELALLEGCLERLRAAVGAGDVDAVLDAEFAFHRELNRQARAQKLAWFLWKAAWFTPHRSYAADRSWGEFAVRNHERLIDAIREGAMSQIAAETQVLFADAAQRLLAHLDRIGLWDEPEPAAEPG